MPVEEGDVNEGGRHAEDIYEGVSRESLDDAIKKAVHAANKSHGTWLQIASISVLSINDPDVGAYRVIVTPGG